jgi:tripartite-type tricarboxylate transporter receptor subunit TctC
MQMSWLSRRTKTTSAIAAAIAIVLLPTVYGAAKPVRIKVIVPSTPGGGADILARVLADEISRADNITVVVEDRPGGSNTIGTESVARATPDGNTLLVVTPEFVINPHIRHLDYDPAASFAALCYLVRAPQLFVVNSASPYRSLVDLLDAARTKPGELTLASAGPVSSSRLAFEILKRRARVNIRYIPYRGSQPAVNAVLGGHVTVALASYPNIVAQLQSGALRALATASAAKIEQMPNVPTVAELGFKDYGSDIWFGIVAPAKTPGAVLSQLTQLFSRALERAEIKSKLEKLGLFVVNSCGTEFSAFIATEYDMYGRVVRDANLATW